MKRYVLIAALLGAVSAAGAEQGGASVPVVPDASAPVAPDACAQLPDRLVLDAGRVELVRAGEVWTIVKGLKPNPRDFIYPDEDKRLLRFVYWSQKTYHCIDTGRRAKH